jgi:hypothetical protein
LEEEELITSTTMGLLRGSRHCLENIMNQLTSSTTLIDHRYLSQMRTSGCKSYKGGRSINSKRNQL